MPRRRARSIWHARLWRGGAKPTATRSPGQILIGLGIAAEAPLEGFLKLGLSGRRMGDLNGAIVPNQQRQLVSLLEAGGARTKGRGRGEDSGPLMATSYRIAW